MFLREQVRAADVRFEVGEGTRTDVAQTQSEEALATALLNIALADVAASEARFLQIVGDTPGALSSPTRPSQALFPRSVSAALATAEAEHPAILAGQFSVNAASFEVSSAEGALLPRISASGSTENIYTLNESRPNTGVSFNGLPGVNPNVVTQNQILGTIGVDINTPIYQGGMASSQVRQAKQILDQRRIEADRIRDQVRANVAQRWAELQAAGSNVTGYNSEISASQIALDGVLEEQAVGQRTTLNVVESQSALILARIRLSRAQRDVVAAAYGLLYAIGRNSPEQLALNVETYDPSEHYDAVQDKWYGTRTPDGR